MSVPYIAWAFAQRGLTPARRVVLIALCERANGLGTCFPSEVALAEDCELSRRAVIDAVQYLRADRGLIAIVTDPVERAEILIQAGARTTTRANVYRILRPTNGANTAHSTTPDSAKSARSKPHNGANPAHNANPVSAKSAPSSDHEGANPSNRVCKKQQIEGAKSAHEPLNEPLNEPRGAQARPNRPGKVSNLTNQTAEPAKPAPHLLPGPHYASPDEARATFATYLAAKRREAHPEDAAPEPKASAKQVRRAAAATIYSLRKYAPAEGAKPERSRSEQIDAVLRPAANVIGEILPPVRRGPVDPIRTVAEQLAALGCPQIVEHAT